MKPQPGAEHFTDESVTSKVGVPLEYTPTFGREARGLEVRELPWEEAGHLFEAKPTAVLDPFATERISPAPRPTEASTAPMRRLPAIPEGWPTDSMANALPYDLNSLIGALTKADRKYLFSKMLERGLAELEN